MNWGIHTGYLLPLASGVKIQRKLWLALGPIPLTLFTSWSGSMGGSPLTQVYRWSVYTWLSADARHHGCGVLSTWLHLIVVTGILPPPHFTHKQTELWKGQQCDRLHRKCGAVIHIQGVSQRFLCAGTSSLMEYRVISRHEGQNNEVIGEN